jgi:hypothetical protein
MAILAMFSTGETPVPRMLNATLFRHRDGSAAMNSKNDVPRRGVTGTKKQVCAPLALDRVESLIRAEKWGTARKVIRTELKKDPDNHWLLTRLGLTYYEERKYKMALRYESQAREITPCCPLVLWDNAGSLQMLGRHEEALELYSHLVSQGVNRIARGRCGEGLARARGLVADCYLRMSDSLKALGRRGDSFKLFEKHLDMRGPGCHSIYPLSSLDRRRSKYKKSSNHGSS